MGKDLTRAIPELGNKHSSYSVPPFLPVSTKGGGKLYYGEINPCEGSDPETKAH